MDNLELAKLDENHKQILQEFKKRVSDVLQPRHDDYHLLRFLKARNFDLHKAEKMFREDLAFRKKMHSDKIQEVFSVPEALKPYIVNAFLGFDKEDRTVMFMNIGTADAKGFMHSVTYTDLVRIFIWYIERLHETQRKHNKQTSTHARKGTFIADLSGLRVSQWCDKTVIRTTIQIAKFYQDHYPETLSVVYVLNVPSFMSYMYHNILEPFIDPVVRKKFRLFGVNDDSWKEELFSLVNKELVPAYLGGGRYGPNDDPKCSDMLNWYDHVPPSLYLTDMCNLKVTDPGVKLKVIKDRSIFEVEQEIEEPGVLMCWEFQTKRYDVKFGLFYSKNKKQKNNLITNHVTSPQKEERDVLIAVETKDCQTLLESGEYLCTKPGTYILHFDNTYSWLRSKCLLYKITVRNFHTDEEQVASQQN